MTNTLPTEIDFYDDVSDTIKRGTVQADRGNHYEVTCDRSRFFPSKRDVVTFDNDPFTIDGVDYRLHNIILRNASRALNGR